MGSEADTDTRARAHTHIAPPPTRAGNPRNPNRATRHRRPGSQVSTPTSHPHRTHYIQQQLKLPSKREETSRSSAHRANRGRQVREGGGGTRNGHAWVGWFLPSAAARAGGGGLSWTSSAIRLEPLSMCAKLRVNRESRHSRRSAEFSVSPGPSRKSLTFVGGKFHAYSEEARVAMLATKRQSPMGRAPKTSFEKATPTRLIKTKSTEGFLDM